MYLQKNGRFDKWIAGSIHYDTKDNECPTPEVTPDDTTEVYARKVIESEMNQSESEYAALQERLNRMLCGSWKS